MAIQHAAEEAAAEEAEIRLAEEEAELARKAAKAAAARLVATRSPPLPDALSVPQPQQRPPPGSPDPAAPDPDGVRVRVRTAAFAEVREPYEPGPGEHGRLRLAVGDVVALRSTEGEWWSGHLSHDKHCGPAGFFPARNVFVAHPGTAGAIRTGARSAGLSDYIAGLWRAEAYGVSRSVAGYGYGRRLAPGNVCALLPPEIPPPASSPANPADPVPRWCASSRKSSKCWRSRHGKVMLIRGCILGPRVTSLLGRCATAS